MVGTIAGGIGIFLFGMLVMTEGLRSLAGGALERLIGALSGHPLRALSTGVGVTALLQSSSATTLATLGFVSSGMMSMSAAISVIIGANIGTTATSWLVAVFGFKLKLVEIMLPAIALGAMLRLMGRKRLASVGSIIVGFGLLFVGIDLLQQGMGGLAEVFDPARFAREGLAGRAILIAIGVATTVIMQSSSAAAATTLTALQSGAIGFEAATMLVIGQNVGTTITAALGAIGGGTEARRAALAHIIFNLGTGLIAFLAATPLSSLSLWLVELFASNEPAMQVAAFHTLFNILGALLFLPLLAPFSRLIERLIKDEPQHRATRSLRHAASQIPQVALGAARRALREIESELAFSVHRLLETGKQRAIIERIPDELSEVRRFLSQIDDDTLHAEHIALFHALDHQFRAAAMLTELPSVVALRSPSIRSLRKVWERAHGCLVGDEEKHALCTPQELEEIDAELTRVRRAIRADMIAHSTRGSQAASETLRMLDALRWLESVAHHLIRSSFYLHEKSPARQADTGNESTLPTPETA